MFACKCLNVVFRLGEGEGVQPQALGLPGDDPFFDQSDLRAIPSHLVDVAKEQPALLSSSAATGRWVVHKCLNCGLQTHAASAEDCCTVLSPRLVMGPTSINKLRHSEKYSTTFRIILNDRPEDGAEVQLPSANSSPAPKLSEHTKYCLRSLQEQLAEKIKEETNATEERIRRYTEEQYAALDAYKEMVKKEHNTLIRALLEDKNTSNGSASCSAQTSPKIKERFSIAEVDDHQTTPKKAAKSKTKVPMSMNKEDSRDSEGLFQLEGMDESGAAASRSDESDTDESTSHDEGIDIPRQRADSNTMAKSLPVNIPIFQLSAMHSSQRASNQSPQNTNDIAASIKALAQSVHGNAVFGELPRPRFSTQI